MANLCITEKTLLSVSVSGKELAPDAILQASGILF